MKGREHSVENFRTDSTARISLDLPPRCDQKIDAYRILVGCKSRAYIASFDTSLLAVADTRSALV